MLGSGRFRRRLVASVSVVAERTLRRTKRERVALMLMRACFLAPSGRRCGL
jgi:hypothetical protein